MQEAIIYIILGAAVIYLGYRIYVSLSKKKGVKGCSSCPANENR